MESNAKIGLYSLELLSKYLDKFESYWQPAQAGDQPEAIHQMRVNARRIRTLLRSAKAVLPQHLSALEPEFKWIARSLGDVRDLDVHEKSVADTEVVRLIHDLRETRLIQLRHDLASKRFEELIVAARSQTGLKEPLASVPVILAAPDLVAKAFRRVTKAGSRIREDSAPLLIHDLRKRAKSLRYTVDCFADLYGKDAKQFVKHLKGLQDLLGSYQDSIVAQELANELRGHGCDAHLADWSAKSARLSDKTRAEIPGRLAELQGKPWKSLLGAMKRQQRETWA